VDDLTPALTRAEWTETLIAAAGVFVGIVVTMILAFGIVRIVHRITRSSESPLDDRLADSLRGPFVFLVGVWVIATGAATLSYAGDQQEWIRRVALGFSVLTVAIGIRRAVIEVLNWQAMRPDAMNGKLHPGSLPLIRRGLTILIFAVAFLIMLDTFGIAISPLLAGLGIGGLAVALALQPLLANVFASSYMLSDSSIRIGDWVEIVGGPTGYVDDIGWRATRIRSFDNNVVIVPNSTLADSIVTNYSLTSLEADTRVVLGVAYEEDLVRVEAVCLDVLFTLRDEWDTALKEHEPICRFTDFGDSNIGILLKMRSVTWADSFLLKHELTKRIHARFAAEGITINYPARRLFMQQGDIDGLAALEALRGPDRPQP
jgi:small-conductance mechanosensitive channel